MIGWKWNNQQKHNNVMIPLREQQLTLTTPPFAMFGIDQPNCSVFVIVMCISKAFDQMTMSCYVRILTHVNDLFYRVSFPTSSTRWTDANHSILCRIFTKLNVSLNWTSFGYHQVVKCVHHSGKIAHVCTQTLIANNMHWHSYRFQINRLK